MNKKKIVIMVIIVIILGLLGYSAKTILLRKSVKGVSTQKQQTVTLPKASKIPNSLQQKLDYIKQEVSKLDIKDIASTSPQVQKLIKDLNALKDYPSNQIKEVCQNICNSL